MFTTRVSIVGGESNATATSRVCFIVMVRVMFTMRVSIIRVRVMFTMRVSIVRVIIMIKIIITRVKVSQRFSFVLCCFC